MTTTTTTATTTPSSYSATAAQEDEENVEATVEVAAAVASPPSNVNSNNNKVKVKVNNSNNNSNKKKIEGQPYMGLSYVLTVVQFMVITLDLFMDTSVSKAWHYTITTTELLTGLYLSLYQFVRIVYVYEYVNMKKNKRKRERKNKNDERPSSSRRGRGRGRGRCCGQNDANANAKNAVWSLLWISFCIQASIVGCAAYSFADNNDAVEWTLFASSIVWGILNPSTFGAVQQLYYEEEDLDDEEHYYSQNDSGGNENENENEKNGNKNDSDDDEEEEESKNDRKQKKKKQKQNERMGPVGAFVSVFRYHFSRSPWLSLAGFLFAAGNAVLTTYQGAVINELTKAVTSTPTLEDDLDDLAVIVREQCQILVLIWAGANACKFSFDLVSAQLFSKLEVWLRGSVFDRACATATDGDSGDDGTSIASYQTNYGSDIAGVVGLYNSLLTGLIVNVLMICAAFVFLAVENWKIALVTLSFLGMGVASGPTNLAGDNAVETQHHIKDGISLLGNLSSTSSPSSASPAATTTTTTPKKKTEGNGRSTSLDKTVIGDNHLPKRPSGNEDGTSLRQRHEDEVLKPIQRSLFKRTFYTNSVETFIGFYSSFLTVIVVITMSWDVFEGDMEAQDFLGTFFVFKQLQSPAKKMSGILKKLVKSTASLQRINDVVLPDGGNGGGGKANETTKAAKQETALTSPTAASEL